MGRNRLFKSIINKPITHSCISAIRRNPTIKSMSAVVISSGLDVSRNLVNCAEIYNNKNVPEEKREYITSYRLCNAAVSFLIEAGGGCLLISDKVQDVISKKLFARFKKHLEEIKHPETEDILIGCEKGLKNVCSLLVMAILVKRLLTPFVVSPLAACHKKRFLDKDENNKNSKTTNGQIFNVIY